jgi:LPPG:FO 2-phospho-L-lactate transferase
VVTAPVVVLAGGTGGAKLARGLLDEVGAELVVIANTGDDIPIHGGHVSPDPDLITFWLADRIDERGWGLRDDTFQAMDGLRELGDDVWFNLGDRDLAIALWRARRLGEGARLTETVERVAGAFGVAARVLPMCDEPVRTRVKAGGAWQGLQEFLIRSRGAGPIEDVEFRGAADARPTAEVLDAIGHARAVVVGPSNPVISIDPILAVPGMREALRAGPAPIVAVSPVVHGKILKGPTEAFLAWAGRPLSSDGIAVHYDGVIDGLVADEAAEDVPTLQVDVELSDPAARRRVARETLRFAAALGPGAPRRSP